MSKGKETFIELNSILGSDNQISKGKKLNTVDKSDEQASVINKKNFCKNLNEIEQKGGTVKEKVIYFIFLVLNRILKYYYDKKRYSPSAQYFFSQAMVYDFLRMNEEQSLPDNTIIQKKFERMFKACQADINNLLIVRSSRLLSVFEDINDFAKATFGCDFSGFLQKQDTNMMSFFYREFKGLWDSLMRENQAEELYNSIIKLYIDLNFQKGMELRSCLSEVIDHTKAEDARINCGMCFA